MSINNVSIQKTEYDTIIPRSFYGKGDLEQGRKLKVAKKAV